MAELDHHAGEQSGEGGQNILGVIRCAVFDTPEGPVEGDRHHKRGGGDQVVHIPQAGLAEIGVEGDQVLRQQVFGEHLRIEGPVEGLESGIEHKDSVDDQGDAQQVEIAAQIFPPQRLEQFVKQNAQQHPAIAADDVIDIADSRGDDQLKPFQKEEVGQGQGEEEERAVGFMAPVNAVADHQQVACCHPVKQILEHFAEGKIGLFLQFTEAQDQLAVFVARPPADDPLHFVEEAAAPAAFQILQAGQG